MPLLNQADAALPTSSLDSAVIRAAGFDPAALNVTIDHRRSYTVKAFGAAQERQRPKRKIVGPCLFKSLEMV